jgi:hypothetical protein
MKTELGSLRRDSLTGLLLMFVVLHHPAADSVGGVGALVTAGVLAVLSVLAFLRGRAELTIRLESVRRSLGGPLDTRLYPYTLVGTHPVLPAHTVDLRRALADAQKAAASATDYAMWAGLLCIATTLVTG